jgi:hypothetical protein
MTERPHFKEHSPLVPPLLFWATDYVYRGNDVLSPWKLLKSELIRKNKYWKVMRILDASGKCFTVDRFEEVPPSNRFSAFLRQKYWATWAVPIITSEKQLTLEEFKKEVERAVRAKGKYDLDSSIVPKTMEKLPHAKTYLEAVEALPKLI